jgi:signal transduction histidine kinase
MEGELTWLRNFADLGYLVAHEINNLLNNICLQISIVELTSSGKTSADLQHVRQMATETAAKLHRFQQLSQEFRPVAQPTDLNGIIQEVVAAGATAVTGKAGSLLPSVHLDLDRHLPGVLAARADLRRLVDILLQDAAAACASSEGTEGTIVLRTKRLSDRIRLVREDAAPGVPESSRESLFEPFQIVRAGSDGLRLAICRAIVRRLGGNIFAEEPAGGGLRIVVQFPVPDRSRERLE